MISRAAAKAIAEAYKARFTYYSRGHDSTPGRFTFYRDSLHDFLYVNDFAAWLLNAANRISLSDRRGLLEFVMKLHMGETVVSATPEWPWDRRAALGQKLLRELAEALLAARHGDPEFGDSDRKAVDHMQRLLELDDYVYKDGVLLIPETSVLDEKEEQGVLEQLVSEMVPIAGSVVKHHLDLAITHYDEGRWDDSIANSRKVLEAILSAAARVHASEVNGSPISEDVLSRAVRVRDYLESAGVVERKEKEAIAGIYGLLSATGGHPYIAERDQARLTRQLALTISQFVLLRLRGRLSATGS